MYVFYVILTDDDNPVFQETGTGEPSDSRFSKSTGDLVVASADEVSDVRRPTTSESTDGEFDGLSPPAAVVQKGWQSQKTHTYYFYQSESRILITSNELKFTFMFD